MKTRATAKTSKKKNSNRTIFKPEMAYLQVRTRTCSTFLISHHPTVQRDSFYTQPSSGFRSVQSVRRKTKTKTRFRFCFLHLLRPIGKENVVKNKNAFLFLIFISPSNRSNKNQIRENMPGMLLYLYL